VDFEIVSARSSQSPGMKKDPPLPDGPGASASEVIAGLYAQAYPMVWGILGRAGIYRPAERCELAHDAFLVAQEVHATRDPAVPLRAWLAAITWNVARNHRALERVKREALVDRPDPVSSEASPEDVVVRRRYLLDLLEGLDDERRAVFDLHEIEGFEVPEIARALCIPVGTASTRLRLAREHVQAAAARLEAGAARVERRPVAVPALIPFGAGAWGALGKLFEDVPAGAERQVWRAIGRTLATGSALGRAAGGAVAATTIAALLATGAVVGGFIVFLALTLPRLVSPPASPITRVPEVAAVVSAVTSASAAPAEAPAALGALPAIPTASESPRPGVSKAPAMTAIDPEEERLIQQAQAAFAHKDYEAARDALREHAARFPRGQLAVDRRSMLAQMPREVARAAPPTGSPPSTLDGGRASHRQFDADE